MEIHHQPVGRGAFKNIHEIVHGHSAVSGEEIHLYSADSYAFEPCEFLVAGFLGIQPVKRAGTEPCGAGVVPHKCPDAFFSGIPDYILNVSAIAHFVPFPVYQIIGPLHVGSEVDILCEQPVILGTVIMSPIDPCRRTRFDPVGILYLRRT